MPTTINGVGTHYYGKKNQATRTAHCHSCGRFGTLESYDTRLWFVVIFIPVIPLGRKRIIDSCSSCRRHLVASAQKYEEARQLQTAGSLERFHREGTPEAALEAHAQFVAFHEYDHAAVVRNQAIEMFPDDASLRVILASHLRQAALFEEMARLNQEAFEIDPELPEARAGVAISTMAQGQLEESRQLLDFMEEPGAGQHHDLGPLHHLAGQFAAANRHEEALELFEVVLREAPHLGQRSDFRHQVRKSERAVQGSTSVLPSRKHSLRGLFFAAGSPYSQGQRKAATIGLVVILGVAGLGISNEYIRRHRVIQVVNGGDPVQIQVDDGPVETIQGLRALAVAEGKHRLKVTGPVQESHDITIEANYFDRWTSSPVWILNPGLEAVLEQMTVFYAQNPPPAHQSLIVGRPFLSLPHVDYAFVDPPDSMQVKGNNKVVFKEVIRWIPLPPESVFAELSKVDRSAAMNIAERRLRQNPDDLKLLEAYTTEAVPTDRARVDAFLQAGLSRRPVMIQWHRFAQSLASPDERKRMLADYETALGTEPSNAALLYLRGRIDNDLDRRTEFYRRSIAADPQLVWPVMALGSNAMAQGKWAESLELTRKAESLPQNDRRYSQTIVHTSRLALGQAEQMVGEYRATMASSPFDFATLTCLFDALAVAGHPEQIKAERAACENRLPAEVREAVGSTLRSIATYVAANPEAMAEFIKNSLPSADPGTRTQYLLATGHSDLVLTTPGLAEQVDDPWTSLGLALGLKLDGKADEARVWEEKAIRLFGAQPDEDPQVVEYLRASTPVSLEALRRVTGQPAEKALLLAVLATHFPAQQAEYRQEAARFNVRRSPPYLLIRRAITAEGISRP